MLGNAIILVSINEKTFIVASDNGLDRHIKLEMATGRAARGPDRAGPENPGPRALRAETGLKIFYLQSSVQRKIQILVNV